MSVRMTPKSKARYTLVRFRTDRSEPIPITLYSRPGCHLCEDTLGLLEEVRKRHALVIEEVDIQSDPDLYRTYGLRIPVLRFADGAELEAPIRLDQIRDAIQARTIGG